MRGDAPDAGGAPVGPPARHRGLPRAGSLHGRHHKPQHRPGPGAAAATALSATPTRGGPASLPAPSPAGASVSASSSPSPPAPEGPAVSSFSLARLSNAVFPGMLAPILLPAGRRDLLMGCVVTGFLKGGWRSLLQHATALLQLLKQDVKTGGRRGDGGRGLERDDAVATGAAEGSPGAWAGQTSSGADATARAAPLLHGMGCGCGHG